MNVTIYIGIYSVLAVIGIKMRRPPLIVWLCARQRLRNCQASETHLQLYFVVGFCQIGAKKAENV